MPLVAHNSLPTFQRLKDNGELVLSEERATKQDIRELHIGFLNMMPDAALRATEAQFIRFIGASNQIAQFYVYPFSLPELNRSKESEAYIKKYYSNFETLKTQGLDALIITGANVTTPSLNKEIFWDPLMEVISWAEENVASILCSCLATHAVVKHRHNIDRIHMGRKLWGVYSHSLRKPNHPLVRDVNTQFDVPHSRYNKVSKRQLEDAGLHVLAESDAGGVHLAVSADQFRIVYFQGHPEYDAISLLKEYKRELIRFFEGKRDYAPPYPENYFTNEAQRITAEYFDKAEKAIAIGNALPKFPDSKLSSLVHNTWGDTGKAIVNNWLGLVYNLTALNRTEQFMSGVDYNNPLGLSE